MTKPVIKEGSTRGPNPSEIRERDAREDQKKYLDKVEKAGKPPKRKIKKRGGGRMLYMQSGGSMKGKREGERLVDSCYGKGK